MSAACRGCARGARRGRPCVPSLRPCSTVSNRCSEPIGRTHVRPAGTGGIRRGVLASRESGLTLAASFTCRLGFAGEAPPVAVVRHRSLRGSAWTSSPSERDGARRHHGVAGGHRAEPTWGTQTATGLTLGLRASGPANPPHPYGWKFRSASRDVLGPHSRDASPDTRPGHPPDHVGRPPGSTPMGPHRSSALLGPNTAGHWKEPRLTWFSAGTAESVTAGLRAPSRGVPESPAPENAAKLPAIAVMTKMPPDPESDVDNPARCCHSVSQTR